MGKMGGGGGGYFIPYQPYIKFGDSSSLPLTAVESAHYESGIITLEVTLASWSVIKACNNETNHDSLVIRSEN